MLGTSMPEATVDEDCDPLPSEEDVCAASNTLDWRYIHPVPKTALMEDGSQGLLGNRILASIGSHRAANLWG
jgi:hypothetical protein